jgi:hypothetical protein
MDTYSHLLDDVDDGVGGLDEAFCELRVDGVLGSSL